MTARFPFTVEYIIKCAACHVEHKQAAEAWTGQELPWPMHPPEWHIIGGLIYCPKHYLALQVDGNTRRLS